MDKKEPSGNLARAYHALRSSKRQELEERPRDFPFTVSPRSQFALPVCGRRGLSLSREFPFTRYRVSGLVRHKSSDNARFPLGNFLFLHFFCFSAAYPATLFKLVRKVGRESIMTEGGYRLFAWSTWRNEIITPLPAGLLIANVIVSFTNQAMCVVDDSI